MAIDGFEEIEYLYSASSNELIPMGSFKHADSGPLLYIYAYFFIRGVPNLGGSETMQLKIYSDRTMTKLLYSSNVVNVSAANPTGSTNFRFYYRFDFNRENINKNLTYYLGCQLANYTLNDGTFEFASLFDYPHPASANSSTNLGDHPMKTKWIQELPKGL